MSMCKAVRCASSWITLWEAPAIMDCVQNSQCFCCHAVALCGHLLEVPHSVLMK